MKVAWYLYPDRNDVQGQGALADICKSERGAIPAAGVRSGRAGCICFIGKVRRDTSVPRSEVWSHPSCGVPVICLLLSSVSVSVFREGDFCCMSLRNDGNPRTRLQYAMTIRTDRRGEADRHISATFRCERVRN